MADVTSPPLPEHSVSVPMRGCAEFPRGSLRTLPRFPTFGLASEDLRNETAKQVDPGLVLGIEIRSCLHLCERRGF